MLLIERKPVFPWKRAFMFIFDFFPLFFLTLFWPPPFSISLSLSLSCSFFLFLPSCPSFLCFLLIPCFSLFISFSFSLLLFHETNNIKTFNRNLFFINRFSFFFGFPVFFLSNHFFLSLFFPDFKLCFCSTSMFLVFKKFSSKGGLKQNIVCYEPVFCKCES